MIELALYCTLRIDSVSPDSGKKPSEDLPRPPFPGLPGTHQAQKDANTNYDYYYCYYYYYYDDYEYYCYYY